MWKIIITTIMAMHMSATMMQPTSKESNPSNIPSLESRANKLDDDVAFWSRWSLFFVALTAFSAVAYGVSQGYLVARSKQATKVRSDLVAAKDQQLKDEFEHRDERIAKVKADGDLQIAAVKAGSDEKIAALNHDAELLKEQNLKTESRLEKERGLRVELEQSIAPRWLEKFNASEIAALKNFAGVHVRIETALEQEPRMAGNQLANLLGEAGWKLDMVAPAVGSNIELFDGVVLFPTRWKVHIPPPPVGEAEKNAIFQRWNKIDPPSHKADEAASVLGDFLTTNGWSFRKDIDWVDATAEPDVPDSIITIRIGTKPNPYFFTEEMKQKQAQYRHVMDEMTRREREARRQIQKADEKWKQMDEQIREQQQRERAKPPLVLRPPEDKPEE